MVFVKFSCLFFWLPVKFGGVSIGRTVTAAGFDYAEAALLLLMPWGNLFSLRFVVYFCIADA